MDTFIRAALSGLILLAGFFLWKAAGARLKSWTSEGLPGFPGFRPGIPVLVYFHSPLCGPCEAIQRPAVEKLSSYLDGRLQVLSIDTLEKPDVAETWGVFTVPTTVFVDGRGRAQSVNQGVAGFERLKEQAGRLGLSVR